MKKNILKKNIIFWKNISTFIRQIMGEEMTLLTQHVNFEVAGSRVSGLIVSRITDIIGAPQQSLSRSMSVLLLDSNDANVVAEMRLVPGNNRRSVLRDHPKIARTMLHSRRDFVGLELLTFVATVTRRTHSLPAMRRHDSLDTTHGFIVSRPRQHQTLIKNRFRATVANLLLNLVRHMQRTAPDLHFG